MAIEAGARLGAYEVLSPLGAGGMGEVYRARDTRLGREVALKVLPEALAADRDRLARFEQEARSASALNHPNIVTIHEIGREGETAYISMELVEGRTLRDLMLGGPMPVRRILGIAAQIADGLAKAHGAGIVHRDLKPENVMVSKDGFVKILDFGLAKLTDPRPGEGSAMPTLAQPETRPGTVMGTVGYMSPEQASGEPVDFRSDQFTLGSMLYEMATGQRAFVRKTAAETMSAIIRDEPEPVARLRADFPLAVRWMLDRCLAKDPEERYASTRDLARDLASVRDHVSEISSGAEAQLASPKRRTLPRSWAALALLLAGAAGGWFLARGAGRHPGVPTFRRLSFLRGGIGNARFASDGRTVVYGAYAAGASGEQLFLTPLEASESRPFEFRGDVLAISRMDELAIFQPKRLGDLFGTLSVVPISGRAPRPLVEEVMWAGADWDPSGEDLAVVRGRGGTLEFPVGRTIVAKDAQNPRFSVDGHRIAFWRSDQPGWTLSVVGREGGAVTPVSSGWKSVAGVPGWGPGGDEIWFTASKSGGTDALWAVRLAGKVRQLLSVPGTLELYDVARDGRVLLGHHTLIYSLRGVAPGEAVERELAWLDGSKPSDLSADGTAVLITEEGEGAAGGPAVYLRTTDGAPATRLAEGRGVALSHDKAWALTRRDVSGRSRYLLVPTGAGQPKTLELSGLNVQVGSFTPDDKRIVFDAEASGQPARVYVADLAGGKPRPIGPVDAEFPPYSNPVSPDGRRAFAVHAGKILVFPLDGSGETHELSGLTPPRDRVMQWTADARSLYVFTLGVRPLLVDLYDIDTGKRTPWKQLPVEESMQQVRLRVTPDGRAYLYGARSVVSELYLVEGMH